MGGFAAAAARRNRGLIARLRQLEEQCFNLEPCTTQRGGGGCGERVFWRVETCFGSRLGVYLSRVTGGFLGPGAGVWRLGRVRRTCAAAGLAVAVVEAQHDVREARGHVRGQRRLVGVEPGEVRARRTPSGAVGRLDRLRPRAPRERRAHQLRGRRRRWPGQARRLGRGIPRRAAAGARRPPRRRRRRREGEGAGFTLMPDGGSLVDAPGARRAPTDQSRVPLSRPAREPTTTARRRPRRERRSTNARPATPAHLRSHLASTSSEANSEFERHRAPSRFGQLSWCATPPIPPKGAARASPPIASTPETVSTRRGRRRGRRRVDSSHRLRRSARTANAARGGRPFHPPAPDAFVPPATHPLNPQRPKK